MSIIRPEAGDTLSERPTAAPLIGRVAKRTPATVEVSYLPVALSLRGSQHRPTDLYFPPSYRCAPAESFGYCAPERDGGGPSVRSRRASRKEERYMTIQRRYIPPVLP